MYFSVLVNVRDNLSYRQFYRLVEKIWSKLPKVIGIDVDLDLRMHVEEGSDRIGGPGLSNDWPDAQFELGTLQSLERTNFPF